MRKWFTFALLGLVVGTTIGVLSLQAADTIKIGFTPPVTGASADEGALQIKAIKLALKQINAAGGVNGKQIDLIIVDNQSTNPGALAALQKAVEQEKVLALVGSVKSTQILAMSDAIKNYGIPTIIGGTNATLTSRETPGCSGFGRMIPSPPPPWSSTSRKTPSSRRWASCTIPTPSAPAAPTWSRRAPRRGPDRGEAGEVHHQGARTSPHSCSRSRTPGPRSWSCTAPTPRTWR